MTTTLLRLREVVSDCCGVDPKEITEDANLQDDLSLSDLDRVSLSFDLEAAFAVETTDADLENFKTVGDIVKFIDNYRPRVNGEAA